MYPRIAVALLVVTSVPASAGLFGPSNYEECLVDKMKGQKLEMRAAVADYCELEFPFEKNLTKSTWGRFLDEIDWGLEIAGDQVTYAITVNNSKWQFTKLKLGLHTVPFPGCGQTMEEAERIAEEKRAAFEREKKAGKRPTLNAGKYKTDSEAWEAAGWITMGRQPSEFAWAYATSSNGMKFKATVPNASSYKCIRVEEFYGKRRKI